MTSKLIVSATPLALTLTVQESFAANANCEAIGNGIEASYLRPPSSMREKGGKILNLTLTGEAASVTGLQTISFNLPHNAVLATHNGHRAAFPLSNQFISDFVKAQLDPGSMRCNSGKSFAFGCSGEQEYRPTVTGTYPNAKFAPAVEYRIGPCEGVVIAPALQQ